MMKIELIDNPKEHRGETAVANVINECEGRDEQGNFFVYDVRIMLCTADKKHRLSVIDDSVVLDSHQLRLMADVLDEFDENGGV